jgi:hypothetical protein
MEIRTKDPAAYARGELVEPIKPIVIILIQLHQKMRGIKQGVEECKKHLKRQV